MFKPKKNLAPEDLDKNLQNQIPPSPPLAPPSPPSPPRERKEPKEPKEPKINIDEKLAPLIKRISELEIKVNEPLVIDVGLFVKYVSTLNPDNYPASGGIIRRLQNSDRKSFITDLIPLVNEYIRLSCQKKSPTTTP